MNPTLPQPDSEKIAFLENARWFKQKGSRITSIEPVDSYEGGGFGLGIYRIHFDDIDPELYFIPFGKNENAFKDIDDPALLKYFFEKFIEGGEIKLESGSISFDKLGDWQLETDGATFKSLPDVSSNSLLTREYEGRPTCVVKFLRQLQRGENVEAEINRHIFSVGNFTGAPAFRASATYTSDDGGTFHMATLFDYVENEGSAWDWTLRWLGDFITGGVKSASSFSEEYVNANVGGYIDRVFALGWTLADLHVALSTDGEGSFGQVKIGKKDVDVWRTNWLAQFDRSFGFMKRSDVKNEELTKVLAAEDEIRRIFEGSDGTFLDLHYKIRQHGDFHLGQILVGGDNFYIIDFEGEPLKPYSERAIHYPALKDVAGVMRSFNYAAFSAYFDAKEKYSDPALQEDIKSGCRLWEQRAKDAFLNGYYSKLTESGAKFLPLDDPATIDKALKVLTMDKALYEVEYEINNRPDWLPIPLGGILDALDS